jgi:hypothetical protein
MNVDPAPHMIGHEMLVARRDSIGRLRREPEDSQSKPNQVR